MMYKMIVVDDEDWVRRGIKECVDWERYNIEIIGEAEDGTDALQLIKKYKPEIMITDVYMPQMNGLVLTKKAQNVVPNMKVIILSGYDDFKYAQSAIKNKAFDYILKPIEVEKIVVIIKEACDQLKKEARRLKERKELKKQLEESLPLVKERYLNYILNNRGYLTDIQDEYGYLNLSISSKNIVVTVLEIEYRKLIKNQENRQLKMILVKNMINESFAEWQGELVEHYPDRIVLILNYKNQKKFKNRIYKLIKEINKKLKTYNIFITAGIGGFYNLSEKIFKSYREALEIIQYKIIMDNENVFFMDDITATRGNIFSFYPYQIEKKIVTLINIGEISNAIDRWNEFVNYFLFRDDITPIQIKRACLQLYYKLKKKTIEWNFINQYPTDLEQNIENNIINETSLETLKKIIKNYIISLGEKIKKEIENNNKLIIKKAIKYMNENYDKNISLKNIADNVHLTHNYFSNLFKREIGETVMSYLMDIRMEEAKKLLRNTDLKIYEISEKVGYEDPNYFGRVFKKYNGLTPIKYRVKY